MARRSNKELLADVQGQITLFANDIMLNEQLPGMRELSGHMVSSTNDGIIPLHLRSYPYFQPNHPWFREMLSQAAEGAIFRLWGQTKVVYAMDDDLFGYLSESSMSSIPTEVMKAIPHPNPYVLLPTPDRTDPDADYYSRHIGTPWGAFVFGRYRDADLMCSTSDERREDLGLLFLGDIHEEDGGVRQQAIRCTVPLTGSTLTVENVVERTIARFRFNDDLGEEHRDKFEAWLRKYVGLVFNSLLYVCTDQPDVASYRPAFNKAGKVKRSARRQVARPHPDDINEIVKLGFRMGPALNEARRRREQDQTQQPGVGTSSRQPPHQRRGSYRTYWTGAGRRVPRLRWVAPYWVSQDLLDEVEAPTAVVRPVRKRP